MTSAEQVQAAFAEAAKSGSRPGTNPLRRRGGPLRLVDREGKPGSLELYESVIRVNLVGTFNVLRLAAASMASNEPVDGERGVCVLTASVAAYEGQIGQIAYASSKAGMWE